MVKLLDVKAIESTKPIVLMIVVQSIYAVVNVMFKMVANEGSNLSVLVAYRYVISSAITLPIALFFERGSLQQNLYLKSLALVPATYTTTMLNLIPATTYVIAVSLRMEKPNLGTLGGKAKLIGTFGGIGGAMILTLYEGKRLFNWSMHIDLLQRYKTLPLHDSSTASHVLGFMLAFLTSLSFSLWFITQSKMSQNFPWHYSIAALTSIMAAIQSIVFVLCTERDWNQWKLDWNLGFLTSALSGVFSSGLCFILIAWCVRLKGPLFVSAFNPLMLVLVVLIASFILDEYITIGSLIGGVLIVCGLYLILWGKSREARDVDNMNGNEILSTKDSVQCDSNHIANSSLTCIQNDHDKNIANAAHNVSLDGNTT
uniref:WAT1-related protein n=1 Tax=Cicer arietinum TaxID=3827 RepID=A0A3Q7XEX2_CICAR|nr:WAT1-related protein At1g68170-like isoform X2 [Cicer arietinum]